MHLSKHHGLGNDFLIALLDEVPTGGAELARTLCDRTTGIGADGLIFGTPHPGVDLAMTLFNADGSAAEISGNGIRCLAQAVARSRAADTVDLVIESAGSSRSLEVRPSADPRRVEVSVDMGAVGSGPPIEENQTFARPAFEVLRADTGEVGNPHLVLEVDSLESVEASLDGPALEATWKPEGINVHFLRHTGPDELTLVHWERGAGETMACGSGATVAATLAHRWGMVGEKVVVNMPGGSAVVEVGESAILIGPAMYIADIEVPHG